MCDRRPDGTDGAATGEECCDDSSEIACRASSTPVMYERGSSNTQARRRSLSRTWATCRAATSDAASCMVSVSTSWPSVSCHPPSTQMGVTGRCHPDVVRLKPVLWRHRAVVEFAGAGRIVSWLGAASGEVRHHLEAEEFLQRGLPLLAGHPAAGSRSCVAAARSAIRIRTRRRTPSSLDRRLRRASSSRLTRSRTSSTSTSASGRRGRWRGSLQATVPRSGRQGRVMALACPVMSLSWCVGRRRERAGDGHGSGQLVA